jgi:hypothetical protein
VSTCRRLADPPLFTLAMMLLTVWQQRRAERMTQVQPVPAPVPA